MIGVYFFALIIGLALTIAIGLIAMALERVFLAQIMACLGLLLEVATLVLLVLAAIKNIGGLQ